MAFNCKLNRNITLSDGGGSCGSTELAGGGIQERIFIYNISDIENLQFENDMRFDNNLIIETIITDAAYFYIDCGDVTYNETQDGNKHTHTLTLTVANSQPIIEDTINDAINHRYLVAFKPKGADLYRVFGWKEGAGLSYTMDIDSDNNVYTITFADESEYALMACYADNFNLADKIFSPIFKPLYDVSYCVLDQDDHKTGYCIASYVVKVNSAGQALDENNMLCEYTHLPQDAYKYEDVLSDGDYNIIDIYDDTASFDGLPVKVFDPTLCPPDITGTISIYPTLLRMNSSITGYSVSVESDNPWKVVNEPTLVSVTPSRGNTDATVNIISNGNGGDDIVTFQNRTTYERVSVDVQIRLIKIQEIWTYPNGTDMFDLKPIVEGGSGDYLYTVDTPQLICTKEADGTLHCVVPYVTGEFRTYTFTFTHSDDPTEGKPVSVNILGRNTNPVWYQMAQYCEEV